MSELTPEQQRLADECTKLQRQTVIHVVAGMTQREAYYAAGGTAKTDANADSTVSTMLSDVKVKAFYDALIAQKTSNAVMTRTEALENLTEIAKAIEVEAKPSERVAAIKQLSQMEGWDAPKELTVDTTVTEIRRTIVKYDD